MTWLILALLVALPALGSPGDSSIYSGGVSQALSTPPDHDPPDPDPATWFFAPNNVVLSSDVIHMVARRAIDAEGSTPTEYQFLVESTSNGCSGSGWIPDPGIGGNTGATYVNNGITVGATCCYRVHTRDALGNTTATSTGGPGPNGSHCATTN